MATQAITFRTFFEGLANSFPQVSQTVYNAMLYQQNKTQMDRMYELEKQSTEAYVETQETQRKAVEMTMEERAVLLPIEVRIKESEARDAETAAAMRDMNMDALKKLGGAEYIMQEHERERKLQDAQIAAAYEQITTSAAQRRLAELDAAIKTADFNMNFMMFMQDLAANPRSLDALNDLWDKTPTLPNKMKDVQQFRQMVNDYNDKAQSRGTEQIQFMTREQAQRFNRTIDGIITTKINQQLDATAAGSAAYAAWLKKQIEDGKSAEEIQRDTEESRAFFMETIPGIYGGSPIMQDFIDSSAQSAMESIGYRFPEQSVAAEPEAPDDQSSNPRSFPLYDAQQYLHGGLRKASVGIPLAAYGVQSYLLNKE